MRALPIDNIITNQKKMSSEHIHNKVVFLRHAESVYNKKGLFTGWVDCGITRRGRKQAKRAGRKLKNQGFVFDVVFCSELKRAKQTLNIVLEEMGLKNVVIKYSSALNERHYGALQGVNKKQAVKKYGFKQVFEWRRSFKTVPPKSEQGFSESLENTQKRVLTYWQKEIEPAVRAGKKVFVSCHGSTLRALIKYFENLSNEAIEHENIPLGIALVFEFNRNKRPIKHYYLASKRKLRKAILKVEREIYGGRRRARGRRRGKGLT